MVEEHEGGMSSRDKKNARRINAEFEFVGMGDRHGRRDRNYWEREQEQPPRRQAEHPPTSAPVVIPPPGPGGRRDGYRAALTVGGGKDLSPGSNTPKRVVRSRHLGEILIPLLQSTLRVARFCGDFFDKSVIQAHRTFSISSAECN